MNFNLEEVSKHPGDGDERRFSNLIPKNHSREPGNELEDVHKNVDFC